MSSSTSSSQSLSRLSHTSATGAAGTASHTTDAPSCEQTSAPPRAHSPTPSSQGSPMVGKSSSMKPSQLLSRPSHSSAVGCAATASHTVAAPSCEHTVFPALRHSPRPSSQAPPRVGKASSTSPSQSLSCPSQSSTPGLSGAHAYSQPLSGCPSKLKKPGEHAPRAHCESTQLGAELGKPQA